MRTVGPKDYVAPGETVYVEGTGMTYTNSLGSAEDFLGRPRNPRPLPKFDIRKDEPEVLYTSIRTLAQSNDELMDSWIAEEETLP